MEYVQIHNLHAATFWKIIFSCCREASRRKQRKSDQRVLFIRVDSAIRTERKRKCASSYGNCKVVQKVICFLMSPSRSLRDKFRLVSNAMFFIFRG